MKNLLVIANLNHASPRMPGIMPHLPAGGWRAHIVTPQFPANAPGVSDFFRAQCPLIDAPYAGDALMFWRRLLMRRGFKSGSSMTEQLAARMPQGKSSLAGTLVQWYQALFTYPDAESTWIRPAVEAALAAAQNTRFDAVLSTAPYSSSHYAALCVKKQLNLPWVADLRDLWTRNHNYPFFAPRKALDSFCERRLFAQADAVVTTSPDWARTQSAFLGRPVRSITNGYEPPRTPQPPADRKFSIVYTGPVYQGRQDPEPVMAALASLFSKKLLDPAKVSLDFFGQQRAFLSELVRRHGLESVTAQHGPVPHAESVLRQRSAQVLLFLQWEASRKGVYTTKLFEYLAARRPILATGAYSPEGPSDIIRATNSGALAETAADAERILLEFYNAYLSSGSVPYGGLPEKMRAFEYPQLALDYAALLDGLGGK